jgi:hypothetical protein
VKNRLVLLALIVAAACIYTNAQAVTRWDDMMEGALAPAPMNTMGKTDSIVLSPYNRVLELFEPVLVIDGGKPLWKLQVQRAYQGPSGVTAHIRFRIVLSPTTDGWAVQVSDERNHSLVKWSWRPDNGGELHLTKSVADAGMPTTMAMPLDTWVELWFTIKDWRWSVYKKDEATGTWALYSQGGDTTTRGITYFGYSFEFPNTCDGTMEVDFFRWAHSFNAPTDPDAPAPPPATDLIGQAKADYGLSYPVTFPNKMVTNSWLVHNPYILYNYFYIQEDDRSAGIKVRRTIVNESEKVDVGARINIVNGYMDAGQREAFAVSDEQTIAAPAPHTPVLPRPLGVLSEFARVGKCGVREFPAQEAIWDTGHGLNNVGLRVRTYGVVTATGDPELIDPTTGLAISYVDDGSAIVNDSLYWYLYTSQQSYLGFKVYNASGMAVGDKVSVTGNLGVEENILVPGSFYPVIRCTGAADVRKY